jgi:hypothetical protein
MLDALSFLSHTLLSSHNFPQCLSKLKMLFFSDKKDNLNIGEEIRETLSALKRKIASYKVELNFTENLNFGFVIPTKLMSENQRKYVRFPITLQARKNSGDGETFPFVIREIGLGGCLTDWIEMSYVGEKGRMEILLQNGNWFPVNVKILYRIPDRHIGMKFLDLTLFEQEVIADLITGISEKQNVAVQNPFTQPPPLVQMG